MARHKKKEKTMPRRDFVKSAAAGVAGLAAASIPASSYARILGANDRVRVGIVGFSDRFRQALLPAFKAAGPPLNFEIVAVSDIWNRRRDEGVAEIERVMGAKPRAFRNNEELYAAQRHQLPGGERIHPVGQVRRHRHGRDDLEREPAGALAPPATRLVDQGDGHGLEALPRLHAV